MTAEEGLPYVMSDEKLYKVVFLNGGKVYELYSRGVTSSGLWGFIEVSELVFETNGGLVVDPTEEKMRQEFEHARVLHLPIQSVLLPPPSLFMAV